MKTLLLASTCAGLCCALAGAQDASSSTPEPGPCQVTLRGPNHRVWSQVAWEPTPRGPRPRTNSYVELASGMHYRAPDGSGEWLEAREEIEAYPGGAVARQGQHRVIFANNLASAGAIDLELPDGQRLATHPLCLAYFDASTGQSVIIAEVKDCQGKIIAPNQVLYEKALNGTSGSIRYTYTRAGLEQDVILEARPAAPEKYGLNAQTTWLQVYTESISALEPAVSTSAAGQTQGALAGDIIDFGTMRLGESRGLLLGREGPGRELKMSKHWVKLQGRVFLIEEVHVPELLAAMNSLPENQGGALQPSSRRAGLLASGQPALPARQRARPSPKPMEVAAAQSPRQGFVLDYITLNSTLSGYVFASDQTYYISGLVTLNNTTTLEGSTVIKFTNQPTAKLLVNGPLVCPSSPYQPALLTSKNDNTVGQNIAGSTGSPSSAGAGIYIDAAAAQTNAYKWLRLSYAGTGVRAASLTNGVWHSQFLNCGTAVESTGSDPVILRNVLMAQCTNAVVTTGALSGEHLTVDQCTNLLSGSGSSGALTNSVLTAVANLGSATLYNSVQESSGSGIYQSVLAGNYYVGAGTNASGTTSIDSVLLRDLTKLTTYPPLLKTGTMNNLTTLAIQAERNTGQPIPGYHYAALDYVLSNVVLTAGLTVTPGVALGLAGSYGLDLRCGTYFDPHPDPAEPALQTETISQTQSLSDPAPGLVVLEGSPQQLNEIVTCRAVQEQPRVLGGTTLLKLEDHYYPSANLRFAEVALGLGSAGTLLNANPFSGGLSNLCLQDCRIRRGAITAVSATTLGFPVSIALKNNVFERCSLSFEHDGDSSVANNLSVSLYNNLIRSGSFSIGYTVTGESPLWYIRDNFFDGTAIYYHYLDDSWYYYIQNSNNGYSQGTTPYFLYSSTDQTNVFADFQSGPLGPYYYPTNILIQPPYYRATNLYLLINAGSQSASSAGLYHFTTTTNQVRETNSTVDIGFHYVALDASGNPVDDDQDNIPDYLENPNGTGHPPTILAQPADQTVALGQTAAFTVTAAGPGSLGYRWRFGGSTMPGQTQAQLTLVNAQLTNAGNYSVVVTNAWGAVTSAVAALTVAEAPSVSLTTPLNGASFYPAPTNITLAATATAVGASITNVSFYSGATFLGQSTNTPFSLTWSNVTEGQYSLTARAFDTHGLCSTSAAVAITVQAPAFILGINLGGESITNENHRWLGYAEAQAQGFSASNATVGVCTNVTIVSPTDPGTSNMLQSFLRHYRVPPLVYPLAANPYVSYLWYGEGTNEPSWDIDTLANVPAGYIVTNGTNAYPGWGLHYGYTGWENQPTNCVLYYSCGAYNLPFARTNLNRVNYILNHRTNATRVDIQNALWLLMDGELTATDRFQLTQAFTNLYNNAWTNGANFVPGPGQIVTVIAEPQIMAENLDRLALEITNQPVSFTMTQTGLTNNSYSLYLWLAENEEEYLRSLEVKVQGVAAAAGLGTNLALGQWTRLGPLAAEVTNGVLTVEVISQAKGDPMLMGLALYGQPTNQPPAGLPVVQIISPTNSQFFAFSPTNILLSATVSNLSGSDARVAFFTNNVCLGLSAVFSNQAQFLWQDVLPGAYTLTASATNQAGCGESAPVTNIVVNAMPVVAMTSPTNSHTNSLTYFTGVTNVTLKATARDPDGTNTIVRFYSWLSVTNQTGEVLVWTNLPGTAARTDDTNFSLVWTNCPVGTHPVCAVATDGPGASSSSDIVAFEIRPTDPLPSVRIIWPTNGAIFPAGVNITILAEATSTNATVTNVEFFADSRLLGSDPTLPYSLTECCWTPGTYKLRAKASDDLGGNKLSDPINITINGEAPSGGGYWDAEFSLEMVLSGYSQVYALDSCVSAFAHGLGETMYFGTSMHYGDFVSYTIDSGWYWLRGSEGKSCHAILVDGTNIFVGSAQITGYQLRPYVAQIVGTNWQTPGDGLGNAVWALTKFRGDLIAGGAFTCSGTGQGDQTNVQRIACLDTNQNKWAPVGNGISNGAVYAIASMGNELYIGGSFTNAGGNPKANYIAKLAGNCWTNLGESVAGIDGVDGTVTALVSCGTNLYVGGFFSAVAGNTNAGGLAIWNGVTWRTLGGGVGAMGTDRGTPATVEYGPPVTAGGTNTPTASCPHVNALAVLGNRLFVGGWFTNVLSGGACVPVAHIAMATWNEERQSWVWSGLDGGVTNSIDGQLRCGVLNLTAVQSTAGNPYDVYVGGEFDRVGVSGYECGGLARWRVGYPMPPSVPLVTITNPPVNAVFTNDQGSAFVLNIAATVSSSNAIRQVDFYADGQWIGSNSTPVGDCYTFDWPNPSCTAHFLKAAAVATNGLKGTSKPVSVSILDTNVPVVAFPDQFTLFVNDPPVSLNVLSNDTAGPGSTLSVAEVAQTGGEFGTVRVSHDRKSLLYQPNPNTYGMDLFTYSATDGVSTNYATVTIRIRERPVLHISSPADGERLAAGTNLTICGTALDYDTTITNIALFINGSLLGQLTPTNFNYLATPTNFLFDWNDSSASPQTRYAQFSFDWSTNEPGFYQVVAVAADSYGYTNSSLVLTPVTIVLTNSSAATNLLVATIDNLPPTVTTTSTGLSFTNYPVITNGLFDLKGLARNPANPNSVSYQLLLLPPEDNQDPDAENVSLANVTPGILDASGFHPGGDANTNLGKLDLTAVPNGTYKLKLTVRGDGEEANTTARFHLDTQLKIGQFSFSEQDLALPVNGIPITVTRTYNSLNPRSTDFGYGWSLALNSMDVVLDEQRRPVTIGTEEAPFADEEEDENGLPREVSIRTGGGWDVTLTLPEGRRTTFAFTPLMAPSECRAYAEWTPPPDVRATLKPYPESSGIINLIPFTPAYWQDSDNSLGLSTLENHDLPGWVLETQDGTKYYITRGSTNNVTCDLRKDGTYRNVRAYGPPKLTCIEQLSGDFLEISNSGIRHHHGSNAPTRSVYFERDAAGRITAIYDPNSGVTNSPPIQQSISPLIRYVYHAQSGNLLQVQRLTDRTTGTYLTTKYHYDHPKFPHYITSIEDPRGVPLARNEYDDSGRLVAVVDADGNRTQFIHSPTNQLEVTVDRMGYTNTFVYDLRGNVTAITNAAGEVTITTYNEVNLQLAQTNALGTPHETWTVNTYDTNGYVQMTVNNSHTNWYVHSAIGELLQETDPLGNVTSNRFDGSGNITNVLRLNPQGQVVEQAFVVFEGGRLAETRNGSNQLTARFYYDASGNLTNSIDANQLSRTFTFDDNGNQTGSAYVWVPPGGGPQVTVSTATGFDAQGRPVFTVGADGNTNWTFYNELGRVDHTVDRFGNTNSFLYNWRGDLIQTTYPDGSVTRTVFDQNGRAVLTTDRNGISGTRTYYDAVGRATNLVRLTNVAVAIASGPRTVVSNEGTPISTNATEYFDGGWVKSRRGPDGQKTSYEYWPDGQLKSVTDPLTNTTWYAYDPAGRQQFVTNALAQATQFSYDSVGRLIRTTFRDTTYITNIFNGLGQRTGQRDQAGLLTQFAYDLSGQLTNVIKPAVADPNDPGQTISPAWSFEYDTYGWLSVTRDANGHGITNRYDALGRQTARSLPTGESATNLYNPKGQLYRTVDFKGQVTEFKYDQYGRTRAKFYFAGPSEANPAEGVAYHYDNLGQLRQIVELRGLAVMTNQTDGYPYLAGLSMRFGRGTPPGLMPRLLASAKSVPGDAAGAFTGLALLALALWRTPRPLQDQLRAALCEAWLCLRGWRPCWSADVPVRRLRLPCLAWRAITVGVVFVLIANDPSLDSLWTAKAQCAVPANYSTEDERITEFSYDFDGRVTQVNSPEGVINYSYDVATGRHTSTCTANSYTEFGYDELGRLKTVTVSKRNGLTLNPAEVTTYTYTKVGSRQSVTLPNGVVTAYQYDELNRLTNLTHQCGTTNLATYSYQLHATGRRTNAVEILRQEDGSYLTNTLSWQYDGMYRLTNEVSGCSASGGRYTNSYTYDPVGNRLTKLRKVGSQTETTTSFYNASDQLLREEITALDGTRSTNYYGYDANGSVIGKTNTLGTVTYAYNLANKLSSVTADGSMTSFLYNDRGIRVRSWATGSNPTLYLIDAHNPTGYAQVLEELNTLGGPPSISYTLGDDVLSQSTGTTLGTLATRQLLYDGHGSTRQLAGSGGTVAKRFNYDAYGVTQSTSSPTPETSLLYCGEQYDSTLQMYNLRARYYNPSNGSFNQRDSFQGSNEDPQSLHKYTYAGCDPVNGADPTGLMDFSLIGSCVVAGVIAGLVTAVIFGIDSALGGKDTGQIIFDAGTGFLAGFSIAALLTLIGPAAFAAIAPAVPYLLLLLGGWGAYDSFSHALIAQGIFRIIVTVVSAGMANAAVRAKAFQFARYLWGKVFVRVPLPSLNGATISGSGRRPILYNQANKEIWIGSRDAVYHADVLLEAEGAPGWTQDLADSGKLVGGYINFTDGAITSFDWVSGMFEGSALAREEARAAASLLMSKQ